MIKTAKPRIEEHTVLLWAGGFAELQEVAAELGSRGVVFDIINRYHRESPELVYPEIKLLDGRFREHYAVHGNYIVVGPGHRNVRVIDKKTYALEFES